MFGGNGFVGQNVCQAALLMGADVVSVNRSGPPAGKEKVWKDTVKWVQADIFKPEDYTAEVSWCGLFFECRASTMNPDLAVNRSFVGNYMHSSYSRIDWTVFFHVGSSLL